MLLSMAVADCSSADALGRSEVLSTGKRPAMVGDVTGMPRLLLMSLSSLMLERAVKMRLLFSIARSLARSLARSWVVSLE